MSKWLEFEEKFNNKKIKYSLEQFGYDISTCLNMVFLGDYMEDLTEEILEKLVNAGVFEEKDLKDFDKKIKAKYVRKDKANNYAKELIIKIMEKENESRKVFEEITNKYRHFYL